MEASGCQGDELTERRTLQSQKRGITFALIFYIWSRLLDLVIRLFPKKNNYKFSEKSNNATLQKKPVIIAALIAS